MLSLHLRIPGDIPGDFFCSARGFLLLGRMFSRSPAALIPQGLRSINDAMGCYQKLLADPLQAKGFQQFLRREELLPGAWVLRGVATE
jgi:hypothetical protein